MRKNDRLKLPVHSREIKGKIDRIQLEVAAEADKYETSYSVPALLKEPISFVSKEWRSYGRMAEWMYVHEGRSIVDISKSEHVHAAEDTIKAWAEKHHWKEKRQHYMKRGDTVTGMVYDLLYSKLLEVTQAQIDGDSINSIEIADLEKLVKMFKNMGIPFQDQVIVVMKVFLRFIENRTERGSKDQLKYIEFVRDFVTDVENGLIKMDE